MGAAGLVGASLLLGPPSHAADATTERVSVSSSGAESNGPSNDAAISADGRFVAFASDASSIVRRDTNGVWDIFVHDRESGKTKRVSVSSDEVQGDGASFHPSISADGRFVAFVSLATNLVDDDTNGWHDILVRDRVLGTTEQVSLNSDGVGGNLVSLLPSISSDGRFVAFESNSTNLVDDDPNGTTTDIFVRDRMLGTTELVSVNSDGVEANGESREPSISADGRFAAFVSRGTNLAPNDTNGMPDVFVRDRELGITHRASMNSQERQANLASGGPSISADGRFVAFASDASNLVPNDVNSMFDIFVRDLKVGRTRLVSVAATGSTVDVYGEHSINPSISADGRYVAFASWASDLVRDGTNGWLNVFVRDLKHRKTQLVTMDMFGVAAFGDAPSISADGRFVAFASDASNLAADDTNYTLDIFVRGPLT